MTIKELEKKLKIRENTCIHCQTLELAKQVSSIFDKLGLKWCNEKHYIRNTNWDKHEENTLYFPFDGLYSSLKFAFKVLTFILPEIEKSAIVLVLYLVNIYNFILFASPNVMLSANNFLFSTSAICTTIPKFSKNRFSTSKTFCVALIFILLESKFTEV